MIKCDNKTNKTLEKLNRIEELINDLKDFKSIDFDNSIPNKYKLIFDDKEYCFMTYNEVIKVLEIIKYLFI